MNLNVFWKLPLRTRIGLVFFGLILGCAPASAATYTEDTTFIGPNPERGVTAKSLPSFLSNSSVTTAADDLYTTRSLPISFTTTNNRSTIYYDRFSHPGTLLTQAQKDTFTAGLASLRGTGVKALLRAKLSVEPTLSTARSLISQFGTMIQPYCDVIAAIEVGFVGATGEWHSSTPCATGADCVCDIAVGGRHYPRDSPTDPCRTIWAPAPTCSCYSACSGGFCTNTTANTVSCSVDTDCIGADTQNLYDLAMASFCPSGPLQRMVGFRSPRWRMIPKYFTSPTSGQAYDGSVNSRMFMYNDGWFTNRYDGAGTLDCPEAEGVGGSNESDLWVKDHTVYSFATGESSEFNRGSCSDTTSCTASSCAMCPDLNGWDCNPSVSATCTTANGGGAHGTCVDYRAPAQSLQHAADFHQAIFNDGFLKNGSTPNWKVDATGAGGFAASCETMYVLDHSTSGGENGLRRYLKKLGYRYVLESATLPASAASNGSLSFSFTLRNDGFARLYNKRTAYLTLDSGTTRRNIPLAVDFRKSFAPGGTGNGPSVPISETVTVPSGMPNGSYMAALYLPDEAATLRTAANNGSGSITLAEEVKANIRFANSAVWDPTNGYNELGTLTIGSVDECNTNADCPLDQDNNVCTDRICNNPTTASSTCGNVANTADCDDGLFCNGIVDKCSGTTCSVHPNNPQCVAPTPTCDEGANTCSGSGTCTTNANCQEVPDNVCTTDTCVSGSSGFPTIAGRIAVSSDGNKNDCDDIGASAVTIGLLGQSGNSAKLVYYGYGDHHCNSGGSCLAISGGSARLAAMDDSTHGIAQTWNNVAGASFDLSVFHSCAQTEDCNNLCTGNCATCVTALKNAINASTASDPLTIIVGGPTDIIGRAMAAATASKRAFVTMISHSTWNEEEADVGSDGGAHEGWAWGSCSGCTAPSIKSANSTATFHDIADQNAALKVDLSVWNVWNNATIPKMKAIYNRLAAGGGSYASNPSKGKTGDISDAGMMWWLVNGKPADDTPTTTQMKAAFTTPPTGPGTCSRTNNTQTCTDGLFCNGLDTCVAGSCSTHAGNPCSGGAACSEGTDTCDTDACNTNAECAESPTDNICTTDVCVNPTLSTSTCTHTNNTGSCQDGLFCTGNDACFNGTCQLHAGDPCILPDICNETIRACENDACDTSTDCDDLNVCTNDICNDPTSTHSTCSHTFNTANCTTQDGQFCNGTDTCLTGLCQVHSGPPCPATFTCIEATDLCQAPTSDACNSNSDCVEVPDEICTTDECLNPALSTSTCQRTNNAVSCTAENNVRCNGNDTCSGGTCSVHSGDPCAAGTTCIEEWTSPSICHADDTPRIDYPGIATLCTATASNTTTLAVDIRDSRPGVDESSSALLRRVLAVFAASKSVSGRCDNIASGLSATYGGVAMTLGYSGTSAITGLNGSDWLCIATFTINDPPTGTSNVVITWPQTQGTVAVVAVPLYDVGFIRSGVPGNVGFASGSVVTAFGPADGSSPFIETRTPEFEPALTFAWLATEKRGFHFDSEEVSGGSHITDPTRIESWSCGPPGVAATLQFFENPVGGGAIDWEFAFNHPNSFARGVFTEFYDATVTTTSTTSTTLSGGDEYTKCAAKCAARIK